MGCLADLFEARATLAFVERLDGRVRVSSSYYVALERYVRGIAKDLEISVDVELAPVIFGEVSGRVLGQVQRHVRDHGHLRALRDDSFRDGVEPARRRAGALR